MKKGNTLSAKVGEYSLVKPGELIDVVESSGLDVEKGGLGRGGVILGMH